MSAVVDALAELGKQRMLLAIHDISFPSDPDEDVGRGSIATAGAARLFRFAHALGFTGVQLGPQGQTSRSNASPYDGTIFSLHAGTVPLAMFRRGGRFAGMVDEQTLDAVLYRDGGSRAHHLHAHDAIQRVLDEAYRRCPDLGPPLDAEWLVADGLFHALCQHHGERSFREWPVEDVTAWSDTERRAALIAQHRAAIDRYAFTQRLAALALESVRQEVLHPLGLRLYGDLQVGYSEADMWRFAPAFLAGYAMGAPPSRTNPEGQPWNYPVLDPDQLDGAARALFAERLDVALSRYDSLRIDHPHGLVCPWVYRVGDDIDPSQSVRAGARLYESPDLADHPRLARFAIARADQLDRTRARYADGWVDHLEEDQVTRYARLFEVIAASARRNGRDIGDLSCEVLSTMPLPLARVLARYGLGRWRITQKANVDDEADVYRAENARVVDWVMLGNHDTAPIRSVIAGWLPAQRAAWVRHLAHRLTLAPAMIAQLDTSDGMLATAMLAELFASDARNISVFWADLFGETERFNAPGTVGEDNWSLRLPGDFAGVFARRHARRETLDIPLALALALEARGSTSGVAAALRQHDAVRP